MLKVGVAKQEITPPVGTRMAGWDERVFPSLAVHDPLWARAMVFEQGEARMGLVSADLLGLSAAAVAEVRKGAAALGIPPQGLLVAGTHTHSGPVFWEERSLTEGERAYWAGLPQKLIEALEQATSALAPARVGTASGWSGIGINRREVTLEGNVTLGRDHFAPFDPEVGVVRVDHADGRPMACLMNYACHAVCLSGDNYLTTADFPGFAVHALEERVPGAMGMFLNGACGNVNPREASVDRGYASGGSFMIAQRAGSALARAAARAWKKAAPSDDGTLASASRVVSLPTNRARAVRRLEEALASSEQAAARPPRQWHPYLIWYSVPNPDGVRQWLQALKDQGDAPLECEVQALRIGAATLLGWPGEVFCELGMELKRRSPFRPTHVIGYANGWIGYVPTPEAFEEGGYEAESASHLADDAGLVLVEQSLGVLSDLCA